MPAVITVLAIQIGKMIVIQILCKYAVIEFPTRVAAVSNGSKSLLNVAATRNHQPSVSVRSLFRDDVDDPIPRISSPQCPAWSANHFDPVDVLQRHVLHVPVHPTEKRTVHGTAVDQHEQLVRKLKVETASSNRPGVGVDLSHIQSRDHAQQIW